MWWGSDYNTGVGNATTNFSDALIEDLLLFFCTNKGYPCRSLGLEKISFLFFFLVLR
jgi:hypothetical protein